MPGENWQRCRGELPKLPPMNACGGWGNRIVANDGTKVANRTQRCLRTKAAPSCRYGLDRTQGLLPQRNLFGSRERKFAQGVKIQLHA